MIILGSVLIFVGILLVFFNISYSKTKSEFIKLSEELSLTDKVEVSEFSNEDIKDLPQPVRNYFEYCKFIGKPKMNYMKASFENVPFSLGRDKPNIKINYTQYNFVSTTNRIAFIDSKMFGIPFQGLDTYTYGKGTMKGVIAKTFTLFKEQGLHMDKASLVTYLAECLIVPSAALSDIITWEKVDDFHVKATISYGGVSASGVFTFNEKYEIISFDTTDRENTSMDGIVEKVPWTAYFSDYKENNGYILPTKFKAVWHYEDGDLIYFNSDNILIEYF